MKPVQVKLQLNHQFNLKKNDSSGDCDEDRSAVFFVVSFFAPREQSAKKTDERRMKAGRKARESPIDLADSKKLLFAQASAKLERRFKTGLEH